MGLEVFVQEGNMIRWGLLVLLLLAGCSDGVDCCIDSASGALVEGFIVDDQAEPVGGVQLSTTGSRFDCGPGREPGGPGEGSASADSAGWFRMRVSSFLGSPGAYCVDIVVSRRDAAPDTTRNVPVRFFEGEVLDTTRLVVHLGG